jgi:hypothetical protein
LVAAFFLEDDRAHDEGDDGDRPVLGLHSADEVHCEAPVAVLGM